MFSPNKKENKYYFVSHDHLANGMCTSAACLDRQSISLISLRQTTLITLIIINLISNEMMA